MAVMIFHIAFIASLAFFAWKKQTALKRFFWPALVLKLTAGVCLGLVYTHYYSVADTFAYFNDARIVASLAREDFLSYAGFLFSHTSPDTLGLSLVEPRALFQTKITSVFNLLTHDNYWTIGFYYSFLSFLASWFLVQIFQRNIPQARNPALISFLFLPSVVFWSSGLLKESLALASLYYLTAFFLKIWFDERRSVSHFVVAAVCLWTFWNLKYYYAAVFLPVACATLLYKYFTRRRALSARWGVLVWLAMLAVPLVVVTFAHPNFHHDRLLGVILENNAVYTNISDPEDVVHFAGLRGEVTTFLRNTPKALFSGLFRPLSWETSSLIQVLPAMENTLVLLLFLAACFRFRRLSASPHRTLILAGIAYVVVLSILITFAAPNFGTLSRYKTGYISFFVLIILCNNPLLKYVERSFRRLVSQ